ncbi:MAG: AlpA family phage regulatory protein [Pseudomonadota bacterium]
MTAEAKTKRAREAQPLELMKIPDALLKCKTVQMVTGLGETTIYEKIEKGFFPEPLRLGARCTRWRVKDVAAWLESPR